MEQRPVIVQESSSTGMILGFVLAAAVVAVALFFWQPWNTSGQHTTIINQAPAAGSAGAGSQPAGTAGGAAAGSSSGSGQSSGGSK